MEGVKGLPFKDQVVFGPGGGPGRRWEAGGERGWAIHLPDPRLAGHPGLTGPPDPPSEAPVSGSGHHQRQQCCFVLYSLPPPYGDPFDSFLMTPPPLKSQHRRPTGCLFRYACLCFRHQKVSSFHLPGTHFLPLWG